jgi:nucleotide-binding universal stress UspA family protein
MSAFKSILVHLDSSPTCLARLQLAQQLAERHDGVATALYAATAAELLYPFGAVASAEPQFAPLLAQFELQRRARAQALVEQARSGSPKPLNWAELGCEEGIGEFSRRALYADLLVLGQREPPGDSVPDVPPDFVESVLIDSGKPALVVPYIGVRAPPGQTVLVAWKATRDAARAVSAAIPLLQSARQVHVALWADDGAADTKTAGASIEAYLRCHGVAPTLHHGGRATREIGEHLLSLAADLGVDLMVMGSYGHTRAREWILGGATRTVLHSMTVPVLMAH